MTREEEIAVGQAIEQAWQRIRQRLCRPGMAAEWHLGKARDILRDPALVERHVLYLKKEDQPGYLAALPQLVQQTEEQDERCARLWFERDALPDPAEFERQQARLIELFYRYAYPFSKYERLVRQEAKPILTDVRQALADPSTPRQKLRGLETYVRMLLPDYVNLEYANVQELGTLDRLRAELVAGHEELARQVVAKYGSGVPDALHFARSGLRYAATLYQVSRGYRFGTYAAWWMRSAIVKKRTWGRSQATQD
jgi:hypothetical protein